jgi:Raf kinase inhibitor-like YbhB/YbcL family protein
MKEPIKDWIASLIILSITITVMLVFGYANSEEEVKRGMILTSPSFENNGDIPKRHTCDGDDISPALSWSNAPEATKSFVLIVDDPDAPDPSAPKMTWVHWVLYNIPADINALPEGVKEKDLPPGTLGGLNDWKKTGYGGPCPPIGKHRYFHKLYALDIALPDLNRPTKADLEKAIEGHILSASELIGLYQRK